MLNLLYVGKALHLNDAQMASLTICSQMHSYAEGEHSAIVNLANVKFPAFCEP